MAPTAPFDVEAFLARPLVARLATAGPTIRPVWYLWEGGAFWIITGSWSRLRDHIAVHPRISLVVDTCDLATGEVRQVTATGTATVEPYDVERAHRKLVRYLGPDSDRWDERFTVDAETDAFVRLVPDRLVARDLSYRLHQLAR